jgi:mRNA-degrading endonuclease RelE of RelBE toxin-antitoxin system
MPPRGSKITVRFGPTYQKDLRNLHLDPITLREIENTVREIIAALRENPGNPDKVRAGLPYPGDRHETWKRRIGRPGASMGKRGALRLAYWWRRPQNEIALLRLYYKRNLQDLPQKEIDKAKSAFLAKPSN